MPHAPLITRVEAAQFGVSADLLAQFDLRPIEVRCTTGGALGTAVFQWRPAGDSTWGPHTRSSSRAPWSWTPPGAFAVLAFAAGSYATTALYTIDEAGTVTRSGAGPDTITASRWDAVEKAIAVLTEDATKVDMQPNRVLPLLSWGDNVKRHAAAWLKYLLKQEVGYSPGPSASGDEVMLRAYEDARSFFRRIGRLEKCPPDIVDSADTFRGSRLLMDIESDEPRGY